MLSLQNLSIIFIAPTVQPVQLKTWFFETVLRYVQKATKVGVRLFIAWMGEQC